MEKDHINDQHEEMPEDEELISRREYLISLKKWSKAVIGGVLLSGMAGGCATGWINSSGGWGNGWRNYATPWRNYSGGWRNSSGGWRNRGGGGWINRSSGGGGGWINRSSGGKPPKPTPF